MKNYSNFTPKLLQWFDACKRDLPWRHTKDPYAIWLSEIILQQTRIVQGIDYWHRFMQNYPTVEQLAAASEDQVLRLWQGLGYYSRARNLHFAAQQIVEMGKFPNTFKEIRTLKGVGDYTAAAIASFAFDLPQAAVDGNVYRVLSRRFGIDTPIDSTQGKKEFQLLDDELLPSDRPGDYNQAMMDFGATLCTPASPNCDACPFIEECVAFRENRVGELPYKAKKTKVRTRHFSYIYIMCNDEIAIHQRGAGDIWQGLWEPYLVEGDELPFDKNKLHILNQNVKHVLSHQIIFTDFYLYKVDEKPAEINGYKWIKLDEFSDYAKSHLVDSNLPTLKVL